MLDSLNMNQKNKMQYFSILSPYQASIELKKINATYHPEVTNPSDYFSNYSSSIKKALNLGIYGADFAYIVIFKDQNRFSSYLKVMKNLSSELNIDEAIDKSILEQLETNADKPDSILKLISLIRYETDAYLKKNMRQDIALLILTGGWIESMYLLCNEYKISNNEELYYYISTQKQTVDNLVTQLSSYYDKSPEMSKLTDLIVDLAYEFDVITCNTSITDSVNFNSKGLIQIHNKTLVKNDSKSIRNIVNKVYKIRQQIVQ